MAALLVFVVYFNFMGLHQTWVAKGQVALWSSLLALHGGTSAVLLSLIRLKDGPFRRWPWQRSASQGAQP